MAAAPITSYATLSDAIKDYLQRTDLATQVPTFIQLGAEELKRRLRTTTSRQTITIAAEETAWPAGAIEVRSARLVTGSGWQDFPLEVVTAERLAEFRAAYSGVADRPRWVCYENNSVWVAPAPDITYNMEVTYYSGSAVTGANATPSDALIAQNPDLYLSASMFQAEVFLENPERQTMWGTLLEKQLNDHRINMDRIQFPSFTPSRIRTPWG